MYAQVVYIVYLPVWLMLASFILQNIRLYRISQFSEISNIYLKTYEMFATAILYTPSI